MSIAEQVTRLKTDFDEVYESGYSAGQSAGGNTKEAYKQGVTDGRAEERAVIDSILSNVEVGHYYNETLTKARAYAFNYCSSLLSINLPNLITVGAASIGNCSKLKEAHLPNASESAGSASLFVNCTELEFADVGYFATFPLNVFSGCGKLTTVIIRTNSIPPLQNLNAFSGTPYASGGSGGKIYVPSALIESYKSATNWSVLYGYGTVEFVALEGSEYE